MSAPTFIYLHIISSSVMCFIVNLFSWGNIHKFHRKVHNNILLLIYLELWAEVRHFSTHCLKYKLQHVVCVKLTSHIETSFCTSSHFGSVKSTDSRCSAVSRSHFSNVVFSIRVGIRRTIRCNKRVAASSMFCFDF